MASAADRMVYEGYSKLLRCQTAPYRTISTGPEYPKTEQDGTRKSISINGLARLAKKDRLNVELTSYSRKNRDYTAVKEPLVQMETKFYALE